MLSVFVILFFSCLTRCLLSFFFSVLLVLGSLFENIFGSELLLLGFGVGRVYSGAVCLCFCFINGFFVPENVSRKFSSGQVRCLENFSGANFCFTVSVLVLSFSALFLPMFLL